MLQAIYDRYFERYMQFEEGQRAAKIFVPVDFVELGKTLNSEPDIVFGRLYYHLDKKFGYQNDDGSVVTLFAPQVGEDRNCVHFPLLASVLAGLQEQRRKDLWAFTLSIASIVLSIAAFGVSLWKLKSP
jgi:hypothetical protein